MRCSDVERLLSDFVEGVGYPEFQAHLKACPHCAQLVADLKWIASESRHLAESDEPPARVWVNIANQLRSEGIIREPATAPAHIFVLERPRRSTAWWLVPVAAAIIAAGAYQLTHRAPAPVTQQAAQHPSAVQPPQPAQQSQASNEVAQSSPSTQTPSTKETPSTQAPSLGTTSSADSNPQSAPTVAKNLPEQPEISPPASADDERFLSEVSQGAPSMRATYEDQLRAVNAEIRETQEYIKWHPGDLDARQHLMEVYQQKAMLYQMALDRVQ